MAAAMLTAEIRDQTFGGRANRGMKESYRKGIERRGIVEVWVNCEVPSGGNGGVGIGVLVDISHRD